MASVGTYSASGVKSSAKINLDKKIFAVEVKSHDLLRYAYQSFLDNGRQNLAKTKNRGEVAGSTKKPWRQKGTGRARFGSKYNPIWTGGGVAFGPRGNENYSKKINRSAKRLAVRQALSLSASEGKIRIIDSFAVKDGKTKNAAALLAKVEAKGKVLIVTDKKDESTVKAAGNIPGLKLVSAKYLSVFNILNADSIIITKKALEAISNMLTSDAPVAKSASKKGTKS